MKKITRVLLTNVLLLVVTNVNADEPAMVNFNLGKSPIENSPVQPVTIYGCDNVVKSNLFWDTNNQVVGNIPHGNFVSNSGKPYYVSKYYISSPPAFRKGSIPSSIAQQPYLGIITPNTFTFKGEKPAQIVYFDYRILNPMYITDIPVDYQHENVNGDTCKSLHVNLIPVNTECKDFPWRNGALGASGIGEITKNNKFVFLPLREEGKNPLQCSVTILDDIVLDYDIYFMTHNNKRSKTVSLTEYYNNNGQNNKIKLLCFRRDENEIPTGCSSAD